MNLHSFVIACASTFCVSYSAFAATEVRFPVHSRDYLEPGKPFQVVFDKAVVEDKAVGKAVGKAAEPGFLNIVPELKCSVKWVAPNVLECTSSAPLPFRAVYDLTPAEGVLFRDGSPVPREAVRIHGRCNFQANLYAAEHSYRSGEIYPWESMIVLKSKLSVIGSRKIW